MADGLGKCREETEAVQHSDYYGGGSRRIILVVASGWLVVSHLGDLRDNLMDQVYAIE